MEGDGLGFPVNPDAGGESDWAGVSGRDTLVTDGNAKEESSSGSGSGLDVGSNSGEDRYRYRRTEGDIV
jgi:hypothetical protein